MGKFVSSCLRLFAFEFSELFLYSFIVLRLFYFSIQGQFTEKTNHQEDHSNPCLEQRVRAWWTHHQAKLLRKFTKNSDHKTLGFRVGHLDSLLSALGQSGLGGKPPPDRTRNDNKDTNET